MNKNFDFQEKLKLICKRVVKPQWFIFKDHIVGVRIIQLLDKYIYHLFSKSKICSIIYVMLLYKKKKKVISLKYRMQKLYPPMLTPKYHKMNTCSKRAQETSRISDQVLKALRA